MAPKRNVRMIPLKLNYGKRVLTTGVSQNPYMLILLKTIDLKRVTLKLNETFTHNAPGDNNESLTYFIQWHQKEMYE